MTDKENNKLDRVFSIISLLDNNLANLITEAPGLTIYLDELKANEFQLKKLFGSAFSDITGSTKQTNVNRAEMEARALKVSGSMRAFFVSTDDLVNAKRAYLTVGALHNSRQEGSLFMCDNLLKMAQEYSTDIEPFGVSAAVLTAFETEIEKFRASIVGTKKGRKEKVAARKKFSEIILDCDRVLSIISGIMIAIKGKDESFYNLFKMSMRIGKSGGGKRKKPDFELETEVGKVALIADLPYDAKRTIKIRNKSGVDLKWGISESETEFTSPPHTLKANATSQKLSTTLAETGTYLILENLSDKTAAIQVWLLGGTKV